MKPATREAEGWTMAFTAEERQLLTAALAGNHPESLAHLRPGVIKKLAAPVGGVGRERELEAALETIRMGTAPGASTEGAAQDSPVLSRDVIHDLARRALRGSVPEDEDG